MLVLVDTLRADHLPCYGYERNTAPVICGIAEHAIVFEDVTATSSWTKPSIASILSGLYAKRHGALSGADMLDDAITILPEILQQHGYRTQAFSGNGSVGPEWNFDQGYDDFVQFDDPTDHIGSDQINVLALPFLRSIDPGTAFFLFVHYVDPHDPYTPSVAIRAFSKAHPKPTRQRFERFVTRFRGERNRLQTQIDYYDDEIFANDRSVGALIDELDRTGQRDRTVVVITSDHGEEFFEHGALTHRKQLYEESLRVPLIISVPGMTAPVRIPTAVSLVDVLPTLLAILDLDAPPGIDGRNALEPIDPDRPVYAEHRDFGRELYAVRSGGEKVIVQTHPIQKTVVFQLGDDPGEKRPAPDSGLGAKLLEWVSTGRRAAVAVEITDQQREILEKLGYSQTAGEPPKSSASSPRQ